MGAQLIAASQLGTSAAVIHTITSPELAYMLEALAEPFLRSEQLVQVLEDWSPTVTSSPPYHNQAADSARLRRELRGVYRKPMFWSRSYCIISCGGAPLTRIKQYVEQQSARD